MKKHLFFALFIFISSAATAQKYQPAQKAQPKDIGTGLFASADGIVFNLEDESNSNTANAYLNILDWLQGRVAGLQVYNLRNGTRVAFIRNAPATVFVDEIRTDMSFLNMLPVADIAAVKIIKQPFALGAANGVIAVYTKRGEETEEEEEQP